jgi:hypothetical protein
MRRAAFILTCVGLAWSTACFTAPASAQNPNYPGYLGVMVVEGNGGMLIRGFIRDTPAEMLAQDGNISRNDTIVKLGGRPTRTLQELRMARNRIPDGKEAKMVLRSGGEFYHVWISRSEAVAAAAAPSYGSAAPRSNQPGSAAPRAGAPAGGDRFFKGGKGEGKDGDFRDAGSGDDEAPKPGNNKGDGEFRDK